MSRSKLYDGLLESMSRNNALLRDLHGEHCRLLEYASKHKGICAFEHDGDTSLTDVIIRYLESERAFQEQPLLCDYCKAETPDPWHGSGTVDGIDRKHIHACDTCRDKLPKPAGTKYVWVNVEGSVDSGFSDSWTERMNTAMHLPEDALDYMEKHPEARSFKLLEYRCLTDSDFQLNRNMKLR